MLAIKSDTSKLALALLTTTSLLAPHHYLCLLLPHFLWLLSMVRPTWADAEQTKFLEGFLADLDEEKRGNGLNTHYNHVANKFLEKWKTEPRPEERAAVGDNEELLQQVADERQRRVSSLSLLYPRTN